MREKIVPVAWMVKSSHSGDEIEIELFQKPFDAAEFAHRNGGIVIELYAATASADARELDRHNFIKAFVAGHDWLRWKVTRCTSFPSERDECASEANKRFDAALAEKKEGE